MEQVKYGLFAEAPDLCRNHPSLVKLKKAFPGYVERAEKTQVFAREIARDLLLPKALELDKKCGEDPRYVDWELWKELNRRKATICVVPESLGGLGWGTLDMFTALEEFVAADVSMTALFMFNLFWAVCVFVEMRPELAVKMMKDLVAAQKKDEPLFFSWALTEPACGSDNLFERAAATGKPSLRVVKVPGGYQLNGRKHFITNGSLAHNVLFALSTDHTNPLATMSNFYVPANSPGFSVGRVERKMGHKAKPTAELILEDVFVPEENVWESSGRGMRHTKEILSLTTGVVASLGVGLARGMVERVINFAYNKTRQGRRLIDENWVQVAIADMLQQINTVRAKCIDFAIGCDTMHVTSIMEKPWLRLATRIAPAGLIFSESMGSLLGKKSVSEAVSNWKHKQVTDEYVDYFKRQGAGLKVSGTDMAMKVSSKALEVVGLEGMANKYGMEKIFRDSKVSQIYEGTNEVNLLAYFKREVTEVVGQ